MNSGVTENEKEIEKIVVPVGGDVRKNKPSLLDQHSQLQSVKKENEISEAAKQRDEERKLLEYVAEKTALKAVQEIAKNILYTEPIKTTWSCPKWLLDKYPSYHEKVFEHNPSKSTFQDHCLQIWICLRKTCSFEESGQHVFFVEMLLKFKFLFISFGFDRQRVQRFL